MVSSVGSHIATEIKEVGNAFYNKGIFNVLNEWATTGDGIERMTRVFVWGVSVASSVVPHIFIASQRVANDAREFLYTMLFFRSLAQLTEQPGYPKLTRYNITSTVLLAIGGLSELVQFSLRTQIVETTLFKKWSSELGQYQVFQYSPVNTLLSRPSQFFLFASSLASSVENIYEHSVKNHSWSNSLKARDILLHIGNGGKMMLVFFNNIPDSNRYIIAVNGAVQIADLIQYTMRA